MKVTINLDSDSAKTVELYRVANDLPTTDLALLHMIKQFKFGFKLGPTTINPSKSEYVNKSKGKKTTLASVIKEVMVEGATNKNQAVELIINKCKEEGLRTTSKSTPITEEITLRLLNAIIRDIRKGRDGWWSEYEYVDKADSVKFRKRET